MWLKNLLLLGLISLGTSFPNPQDDDQSLLEGIAGVAGDGERYGGLEANVDADFLAELFGGGNEKPFEVVEGTKESSSGSGVPKEVIVDDASSQCAAYAESGYRCVPYYSCDEGEIITDGGGLINPRFGGLDDVELNPETSKCPGSLEICCRHPDWFGLPINQPVKIQKPPEEDLKPDNTEYDNDDDNQEQDPKNPVDPVEPVDPEDPEIDVEIDYPVDPQVPEEQEPKGPADPDYPDNTDDGNYGSENEGSSEVEPPIKTVPTYASQCGKRNINGVGVRIQHNSASETETQFAEWPHMCAVLNTTEIAGTTQFLYIGGGSLIAPNVVLTAAHIIDTVADTQNLVVRCGEWDTQDEYESLPHQDVRAKQFIIHPGFVKRTLANDFAVIVLEEDFKLNAHIDTICLPDQYEQNYDWSNCVATGWGKDTFGKDGVYQVIMKQVELDMVDRQTCENALKETKLGRFFELHESFNCAGGEDGLDTCTGDGGGPLVCPGYDGYYQQTGIVAWGIGCGTEGVPGVYANVTEGLCFIDYATRCVQGQDADYYGLHGCKKWAKRQYCELKNELEILKDLIEATTELREKGKLFRKSRGIEKLIPEFENMITECDEGEDLYDCDVYDYFPDVDDLDISIHSRQDEILKEE